MSGQHTPGPWTLGEDRAWPSLFRVVTGPAMELSWCRVGIDITAESAARREADGRLIAAAPDLKEALADMVALFSADNVFLRSRADIPPGAALAAARAAIAKATGA